MIRRVLGLILLALLAGSACRSVQPLANTHTSAEALAAAVLTALNHSDGVALEALALSEREFRDHVWPDLPASRPERNLPFSYVWGDLRQKSALSLSRTVREYGGRQYKLERVTLGDETRYSRSHVHREPVLTVRDAAGVRAELRVSGSMLEQDGAWKIFSWVVDD